ncbi:MAG: hypothetical protein NUW24_07685 [Anaerolineae bacterium]|jgi:hypothetical protein|nr:hypothetical protein [Anaerolineae bacterium]MDH7474424.1 hypothetical protein [Anaerolineae bacterium]
MEMIAEKTVEIARKLAPAKTADASVRQILINEIRRRLNRYDLIDRQFRRKYGMTFQEFCEHDVVKEKGYSWEVESDFCDWEMAVTGIESLMSSLSELEKDNGEEC